MPELDGLRAIAVLLVVGVHLDHLVPAGYIGVTVFFCISGYLIGSLLLDERQATGRTASGGSMHVASLGSTPRWL